MAESNGNGKLPISIVTTVVNKISDFTKEMEILRAQLPDKTVTNDKIDNLDKKLDRSLTVIKTVFVLAMVVIGLSFLGARLLDWHASSLDNKDMIEIITKKLDDCWEEKLKEILEQRDKTRADERNSIDNQVGNLNVKMDRILKKMEELNKYNGIKEK